MIINNIETWGKIKYDTKTHIFRYVSTKNLIYQPYVSNPLVLNCYLTNKCNMSCLHCVAKDLKQYNDSDLVVTSDLIKRINNSKFLVIVITGGEPLLPEYEPALIKLINGIEDKGIIIDTNGTYFPSEEVRKIGKKKTVLFRISLDSVRDADEVQLRIMPKDNKKKDMSKDVYWQKLNIIDQFCSYGSKLAIQSVLYKKNISSIKPIINQLQGWGIDLWFIQRLIPTNKVKETGKRGKDEPFFLPNEEYEKILWQLERDATTRGVKCVFKRDRRHNCVFLLVQNGFIYTSENNGRGRILLGKIGEIKNYFEVVSSSEHSTRYYSEKNN